MSKLKQLYAILLAAMILIPGVYILSLQVMAEDDFDVEKEMAGLQMIEQTTLLPLAAPPKSEIAQTINVIVTGYSSTVAQTDNDPFITASGEIVRDGIVANNLLAFGTQIKLPEILAAKHLL